VNAKQLDILRRDGDSLVKAVLNSGLQPEDLLTIENAWSSFRGGISDTLTKKNVPRLEWPQSLFWDWSKKAPLLRQLQCKGFGLVCDNEWQALMLTKTWDCVARLPSDKGKPIVYVDFLEVAPWNWNVNALGQRSKFRGIGSLLLREAILQSEEETFQGRVGLHSLPQSESFYEKICGMTRIGPDPQKQNLVYYEFERDARVEFRKAGK